MPRPSPAARGLNADRVYRLLRALTTVGIVTEGAGGQFALTPLGGLLTASSPHSMRTAAELLTEYHAEIWGKLDGALAGGVAFEALKGQPMFDWLHANPTEGARFQRMMVEVHSPETPAIVAAYDFAAFNHIVDVGGGNGSLLSAILAAHPGRARHPVRSAGRHRGGAARRGRSAAERDARGRRRVRDAVPEGGDLYLCRHMLHDYDDPDARRILASIRRAMQPGTRAAGAGKDRADRRHAGAGALARSARDAAGRRPRAHRASSTPRCSTNPDCGSRACCRRRIRRSRSSKRSPRLKA